MVGRGRRGGTGHRKANALPRKGVVEALKGSDCAHCVSRNTCSQRLAKYVLQCEPSMRVTARSETPNFSIFGI